MKDVIDGAKTEVETFPPYMLTHANLTPQVISLKCDKYSASVHDCLLLFRMYLCRNIFIFCCVWLALSFELLSVLNANKLHQHSTVKVLHMLFTDLKPLLFPMLLCI